jgi:hypothetical protein
MQFTIRSQAWWWVVTGRDVATMLNIRAEEAEREMTK